jgi:hypothetical protein
VISDEPTLEIAEVRTAGNDWITPFALDDQQTTLRINLREAVPPNGAVDIQIKFKGSVPEIDPEETGLVTHILQQVSAAIRSTRELRRARDTNFVCRGVMLLAPRSQFWPRATATLVRKVESSIADSLTTDTADFDVTVSAAKCDGFYPLKVWPLTVKREHCHPFRGRESARLFRSRRSQSAFRDDAGRRCFHSINLSPDHEVVGRNV